MTAPDSQVTVAGTVEAKGSARATEAEDAERRGPEDAGDVYDQLKQELSEIEEILAVDDARDL